MYYTPYNANNYHQSPANNSGSNKYTLFLPRSGQELQSSDKPVDWRKISEEYDLKLLRERDTQATVEADSRNIMRLLDNHPEIKATISQKYHKLTP